MTAQAGHRPRVRRNLRYVRQILDGRVSYVVKDPIKLQYFRFGELEAWLMQQMDGTRELADIAQDLSGQFGMAATGSSIEPFVARLKELGLAERSREEQRVVLSESLRRERRDRIKGHGSTLLRMRFSLGDPDVLLTKMEARLRFCWTPQFVVLSVLAMLGYAIILTMQWPAFSAGVAQFSSISYYTPATLLTLYLSAIWIIVIHEFGHGLTCKHFGGEVHEMGGMLIYFMPALYCNVNDAWTFEKRSQRLWVTFAGGWIQLVLAFLAALAWIGTEPETFVHHVAFASLFIAGGMSVLINFNPLIPLDGYYALMDWLEIPNLRGRSFRFLGTAFKRHVLRMDVAFEPHTARERNVFIAYGLLAIAYSVLLLGSICLLISRPLIAHYEVWGLFLAALAVFYMLRRYFGGLRRVLRVWWADQGAALRRDRRLAYGAGMLALLLLASFITPWIVSARGSAWVEPPARVWLRSADGGLVEQIRRREGQFAKAGDTVAVLSNPELELRYEHARTAVEDLEHQAAGARARGQTQRASTAEAELAYRRGELRELERRRAALTLRAPFDGYIVTPHLEELIGSATAPGDSLMELWHASHPRLRIRLPQRDAARMETGAEVRVRFDAAPGRTVRTRVQHVGAAAQGGYLELIAPLPELDGFRPGMVGRAKVRVLRTTLAGAVGRSLRRTIRVDWWL
jgi:putative peptide zinc metalloprotease protein